MQSFRPLQRRQGLGAGLTRTGGDRLTDWRPSDTNIDLGLDSGFLVYTLSLSLLYLDNERYADPLSWLDAATTGLNLSLCGLRPGDNAGVRDTDQ